MSRAVRKRRKRCPGMPEERVLAQELLFQPAFAKWEKKLVNLPSSHSYPDQEGQERLAGGADDVPGEDVEGNGPRASAAGNEKHPSGQEETPPEVVTGTSSPASPSALEPIQDSTGDKEVDEIFDNATQHLREAGRALASLTGNVQHDLKLMIEEITAKIENWGDSAQSEVDSIIDALNEIRKRIISQTQENETKLAESEATKAMYEKAMIDSGMKTTIGTDPSYSRVQLPPLQPGGIAAVPGLQQTPGGMTPAEVMSRLPPGSQLQADGSVLMPSGVVVPLSAVSSVEIPAGVHGGPHPGMPMGVPGAGGGAYGPSSGATAFGLSVPGGALPTAGAAGGAFGAGAAPGGVFAAGAPPGVAFGPSAVPGGIYAPTAPPGSAFGPAASPGGAFGAVPPGGVGPATIPIEQLTLYDPKYQVPATAQFGQHQREVELEAEVSRLRRENEKIMNERADYENAIQRAILKGVTSLNDEALKVLKNPRMECWTPCLPCNSADEGNTTMQTSTSKLMKDCWTSQREKSRSILPSKFDVMCRQKPEEKRESSRCRKTPALSVCYTSSEDKKQSQTNMMWTESHTPAYPRISARPLSVGSKTVCLDGKYRKGSSSKDRNMCPARDSSRENSRAVHCIDIFTPATRQNSQDPKRCEPCNRIRRIFDH